MSGARHLLLTLLGNSTDECTIMPLVSTHSHAS